MQKDVKLFEEDKPFRRIIETVDYVPGEVEFVLQPNRFLRRIEFVPIFTLHVPQARPVYYSDCLERLIKITFDGRELKEWDLTTPQGFPGKMHGKVKWGTSSDLALANPPEIMRAKLLIIGYETIDREGIKIDFNNNLWELICKCGKFYDKPVKICKCGKELLEGLI